MQLFRPRPNLYRRLASEVTSILTTHERRRRVHALDSPGKPRSVFAILGSGFAALGSALCAAKALLSCGTNGELLRASDAATRALLEPFTLRLAEMNNTRMATRVWRGIYEESPEDGFGRTGEAVGHVDSDHSVSRPSDGYPAITPATAALSAAVWTTVGNVGDLSLAQRGLRWMGIQHGAFVSRHL